MPRVRPECSACAQDRIADVSSSRVHNLRVPGARCQVPGARDLNCVTNSKIKALGPASVVDKGGACEAQRNGGGGCFNLVHRTIRGRRGLESNRGKAI
jgi:hypothetical protein